MDIERCTLCRGAEPLIEIDGPALHRNPGRRQAARILIDDHGRAIRDTKNDGLRSNTIREILQALTARSGSQPTAD